MIKNDTFFMAKNDFPDPKLYFAVARLMDHNCSDVKHTKLSYVAAKPAILYSHWQLNTHKTVQWQKLMILIASKCFQIPV